MFARSRSTISNRRVKFKHKKRSVESNSSGKGGVKGRTIRKVEAIQSWRKKSINQLCTPPQVTPLNRQNRPSVYDDEITPSPIVNKKRHVGSKTRKHAPRRQKDGNSKTKKKKKKKLQRKRTLFQKKPANVKLPKSLTVKLSGKESRLSPKQRKLIKSVCKLLLTPGKIANLRARRPEASLVIPGSTPSAEVASNIGRDNQPLANTTDLGVRPLANTTMLNLQPLAETTKPDFEPLAETAKPNLQPLAETTKSNLQALVESTKLNIEPLADTIGLDDFDAEVATLMHNSRLHSYSGQCEGRVLDPVSIYLSQIKV